jgi:outer membrane protein assembly factor BamB
MKKRGLHFLLLLLWLPWIAACTASSPSRAVLSSSLPVQLVWQAQVDEPIDDQAIIAEDLIVVPTSLALYALNKQTGERLWRHEFDAYQPSLVSIAVGDKTVIYGDKNGSVTAIQAASGQVIWRQKPCGREDNFYGSTRIVVAENTVYAAFQPTAVEARSLNSGELIWSESGHVYPFFTYASRLGFY